MLGCFHRKRIQASRRCASRSTVSSSPVTEKDDWQLSDQCSRLSAWPGSPHIWMNVSFSPTGRLKTPGDCSFQDMYAEKPASFFAYSKQAHETSRGTKTFGETSGQRSSCACRSLYALGHSLVTFHHDAQGSRQRESGSWRDTCTCWSWWGLQLAVPQMLVWADA